MRNPQTKDRQILTLASRRKSATARATNRLPSVRKMTTENCQMETKVRQITKDSEMEKRATMENDN